MKNSVSCNDGGTGVLLFPTMLPVLLMRLVVERITWRVLLLLLLRAGEAGGGGDGDNAAAADDDDGDDEEEEE